MPSSGGRASSPPAARRASSPACARIGFPTIKQCQDRCDAFALRLSKLETAPDAYFKPEWYKNWWLGDAEADVPAVVALVSEHLGCA